MNMNSGEKLGMVLISFKLHERVQYFKLYHKRSH